MSSRKSSSGSKGRGAAKGRSLGPSHKLKTKVRTAKGRTVSSSRWLERQLNDPYVQAAHTQGYQSRAAFKLSEIDDRFKLLSPGACVVDLGAAPGGWSQIAAERVNSAGKKGMVLAVDLKEIDSIEGVNSLVLDIEAPDAPQIIKDRLTGLVDVVLSDMAASASGHRQTDHLRIIGLCEAALDLALEILAPGGHFLAKVLRGGTEADLLKLMKSHFEVVKHVKPPASRSDSAEMYVLALRRKAPN